MASFQIVTRDGDTYTDGEERRFEFRGVTATLTGIDSDGDFVVLEYTHDIKIFIPEANIRHVAGAGLAL